uniref:Potassium channel domain-containing protein n=1 Tax=Acrobeloides nanus TaxID=290746 RepID=A0A914DZ74_9BILA
MNEELHVKELDGLLESPGHRQRKSWKQYVKLTLPHVALVTFVCIYAMAGAWVFYTIESPHEDRLKVRGVEWVDHLRKELLHLMWNKSRIPDGSAKAAWASTMSGKLKLFNENLYKAYKGQYVRYGDIRVSKTPLNEQQQQRVTLLKHRSMKSQHPGGKLWTRSSALFFAATTMATIGYGNIVPVTAEGRIACVVFALFGAPLAIITIGDLGKFMSECTIWLYKKIKEIRQALGIKWRMWKLRKSGVVAEIDEELSIHQSLEGSESNQEDETEVPVLLVFAILLLYMALGGILFAFLESWTYVDAFYFCFVSLTTIGFGDLVPDRHEFIVIMLIYLGVGLAVTTMCIDLVGIQYLLKRKRAIERKLAMGDVGGAVNMIHQIMEETEPPRKRTFLKSASQNISHFNEEKASLRSEPSLTPWTLEGVLVDNTYLYEAEKLPTPELLSGPSPPPSIKSSTISTPLTNSSDSARSRMYDLWRNMERGGSIESGPDISIHCSISTSPSVYERENLYENYRSPQPSLMSFQFTFPIPIDFRAIAEVARRARRVLSCPSLLNRQSSKPPSEPSPPSTISSTVRTHRSWFELPIVSNVQYASPPVLLSLPTRARAFPPASSPSNDFPFQFEVPAPFMLSKLAAQVDLLERFDPHLPLHFREGPTAVMRPINKTVDESVEGAERSPEPARRGLGPQVFLHIPKLNELRPPTPPTSSRPSSRVSPHLSGRPLWYYNRWEKRRNSLTSTSRPGSSNLQANIPTQLQPVLKRKKIERLAKRKDPVRTVDWLNISPRAPVLEVVKNDLSTLSETMRSRRPSSSITGSSIVLVSPQNPMGLTCMEEWDSYIQMLDESMKPRATSVPSPIPEEPLFVHKDLEFIPLPKPPPPPLPLNRAQEVEFLPYEFEPEPRIIPEVEVELDIEPQVSIVEAEAIAVPSSSVVEPLKLSIGEGDEDVISPVFPDESSDEDTLSPMFEIDLGAFELVDSGISAEALLSNEDPVIFHKDMPVHSVHHDTVQTEAALENLMNAPESMLSHVVPPTMVADNYCFVVDGDRVRMSDVMGDDEWWRHTSRPTKHFYSEDLKKFFKVNVIATKGKIISARIPSGGPAFSAGPSTSHSHSVSASVTSSMMASSASSTLSAPPLTGSYPGTALHSAATTPRSSFAARSSISSFAGRGPRGEKVNLEHVYKVIRVYSFWRTCTSFHRIVTMIDKVVPDLKDTKEFKKRLFVQYLWRNAKPYEKARVQREFDPRSQRILRFVTDPAIKKRVSVMPATTSSRRTQPSTSEETAARQSRTQSRTQSRASSTSSKKSKP